LRRGLRNPLLACLDWSLNIETSVIEMHNLTERAIASSSRQMNGVFSLPVSKTLDIIIEAHKAAIVFEASYETMSYKALHCILIACDWLQL
jgi:hypothetical protein